MKSFLHSLKTKMVSNPLVNRVAYSFSVAFLVAWDASNFAITKVGLVAAALAGGRAAEYFFVHVYLEGRKG